MPVEFVHDAKDPKDAYKLLMAYDGSGRRISKTRLRRDLGASDWAVENVTHYTGIGTEVRETHVNGQDETKVVVNMPNGLGRYMPEDAVDGLNGVSGSQLAGYRPPVKFEWYLKNHIGSTMLVYGTSAYSDPLVSGYKDGVKAAYDYRAFGEQVSLAEPTEKVTENFTGKEKDDETDLNYFGARYLDPMLGMWVSVDPARQFFASYAYAGNRTNPTNGIDANGDYLVRKRGGSYEIKTVSKAEAVSGWFIKDFTPLFMKGPGFAFTIVKDYIDEKNSSKGQNGRYLGKDLIIQGAEKLTSYENKAVGKGVGAALGVFDAYRSFKMLEYDSPEFIENFNSRMISNGGDSYNSFSSPEDAHDFANKVQQSLEPNGNVTYGDLIIENE